MYFFPFKRASIISIRQTNSHNIFQQIQCKSKMAAHAMRANSEQLCQLQLTTLISIMYESPFLWQGTCAGKHKDVFVCVTVCRGRMKGALSII